MEFGKGNRVAAATLGCKVNLYDTEAMLRLFGEHGYEIVDFEEEADIYLVNTCTVTNLGDKKSRQMLRRAKKTNPAALVVAAGCYAQVAPQDLKSIHGVNLIVGTKDRSRIVELVENYIAKQTGEAETFVSDIMAERDFEPLEIDNLKDRTRAYLKIQEGCDRYCSYCIIPYARGPVRSRSPEHIMAEVRKLADNGYKEVVLTGIHVASYGKDLKDTDLLAVLKQVHEVPGIERIRFSSVEPTMISDDFIHGILALPKVCDHFHLSLQSGCDRTLSRMNRRYTTAEYAKAVERLRKAMPDVAITTDVIVGFPGEALADFEETCRFVQETALTRLHVFPYAAKKGTKAAELPDQIPREEKERRSKALIEISDGINKNYLNKFVEKPLTVLFEREVEKSVYEGHSTNFIPVRMKSTRCIENEIYEIKVRNIEGYTAIARDLT